MTFTHWKMTWKTMCEGHLGNSNNIPTNFCFLQAELLLVIGGNCNARHPMAVGRLPKSSEGQQWINRCSLASFYDILLWCLVSSILIKNYSRHDSRIISTGDVTAPLEISLNRTDDYLTDGIINFMARLRYKYRGHASVTTFSGDYQSWNTVVIINPVISAALV